ncbi:AAA-family ATPase [Fragilaria crotonensis]|nr:AAA-family ATPase [Fragilaria crotonensis]
MVGFNSAIHTSVVTKREYGDAGSPWEFNLRDVFRWCELAESSGSQDVASFGSCARDLYLQRFRTSADRRRLSTQFKSVFDSDSIALEPVRCVHSDESVTIGSTSVDRSTNNTDAKPQIGANFTSLRSLLLPMEAVTRCIVMNWPCLIVGQSGTGKTSLLRSLACNLNVKLVDVCLTPATDVNELVGSFEQVDCLCDEKELIWTLGVAFRRLLCTVGNSRDELELASQAYETYEVLSKLQLNDNIRPGVLLLGPATTFLQIMKSSRVRNDPCVMRIEILMGRLRERENVIEKGGRFCWIDGILVDAMVNGYWLHLENVNLCSSSVLDRLNPVMEPGGELLLSETGTQDNGSSHRSIKPHRNFRLFLSMNPDRGEVSRAMRNRCVEVSLLAGTETPFVDEHDLLYTNLRTVDQMDVLSRNGITTMDLVTCLLRIHQTSAKLCCEASAGAPSLESPRQMASGVRGMRRRGLGIESCLGSAMEITYEAMAFGSAELISVASTHREWDGLECRHAPLVPGIRENWSIHPDLACTMLDARLIQCQHLALPKWLRRFRSAEVSPRETTLNEVCKGVEESTDEREFLLIQSLLMYLVAAFSRGRNAFLRSSFLDHFSNKHARILAFLSKKLPRFEGHMLSVLVDRWAVVVLELQERKRAEMIGNVRIDSRGLNVFDVSYWLHAGKIERSLVQCPVTPVPYLLFRAIDEWSNALEDRVLGLGQTSEGAVSISELRKLYGARDQLWIFFKKTEYVSSEASSFLAFDETRFIVQWTWFKKAVSSVNRSFRTEDQDLMPSRRKLDSLIRSIDMVLLDGDGLIDLAGDLLWKKGGHPLVSANSLYWHAILDIRKTCLSCSIKAHERFNGLSQIETSQLAIDDLIELHHPVLFIEQSTKQDLLEALCMAYYSSTEELSCRSPADIAWVGDYHVVCQGVEQAKASFVAAWKAAQVDTTIATVENSLDVEMLEQLQNHLDDDQSQVLDPQQIMRRFAEIQIAPIVEFWLIHSELQLISEFSSILTAGFCDKVCRQTITMSARRFVQVALACPVWEVADLRPFQTLVWAFDSPASEVALCQLLKCLLPIMLYASSRHLWRNTLNDLGAVSSILEYPLQWSASKHVDRMPRKGWQTSVGPSRVWEHARTDAILKLIGPEFSASLFGPKKAHYLTLENHQARESQSKALLRQISTFATDLREHRFPSEALYLFSNVIEALDGYFPDNGSARIVSSLRKGKNLLEEDVVDIQYHISCCTHSRFKECHHTIISPLLLSLLAAARTKESHNASLAWIFIGLLRVHLLVPQSPLDPGQKPIAKVEQLHTRLAYIRRKIATFRLDSGLESGDFSPASVTLDEWESEARVTMRKIGSQEKKMVDRGQQCPLFIDLFRAIRGFWKSTANPAVVRSIADPLALVSQTQSELLTTLQREQNWQVTAASFCDQVTTHFDSYDDVVLPFVVAVQCIQRGLRELRDRFSGVLSPESTLASLSLTNLLRFPFQVADHHLRQQCTAISVLTRSPECESDGAKKCALALAISALSRYRIQKRAIGFLESTTATQCTSLFDGIIKSWIKFVDGLYVKDITDEAAQERLYREQFPDHVKDFVAFVQSPEDDDSDNGAEEEFPSDMMAEVKLSDDLIAVLYELYQELFSDTPQINTNSARLLSFHFSYGGAHLFRSLIPNVGIGLNLKEDMGSHCLAVALSCSGRTSLKSTLMSSKGYSFHNDPNPVEIRKASAPLQSLLSRTSKLLTAFPGHEILISLGQVAEFVRKLELTSTSVGKAMTGLEVVLRKAQEWEEHASERVKLGSCLVEIRQLVTSWRRLELTNWASLLDAREERFAKRARRHWTRLFSVLNIAHEECLMDTEQDIAPSESLSTTPAWIWKGFRRRNDVNLSPGTAERMDGLTKLLDTFILTSCVGEFEERIGLVKSLACQFGAKVDIAGQSIFRILSSICSYYSQFLPLVASRQNAMRSPLESKLKDEVKLAKWDEQSYYALVESTERNHRKLMKHLRGYDDVLEVSLSSLLEEYYSEGIRAPDTAGTESSTKVPSNREIFPLIENSVEIHDAESMAYSTTPVRRKWESALNVGLDSDEFVRRMSQYHKKMTMLLRVETEDRQSWAQMGSQLSADVCVAIFDRIQSLRKDKTSQQMKQRAVSDLFKALKKNGFKNTKWSVPGELRDMKHIFLLPVPSPCGSLLSEGAMTQLANAKSYFERSLLEVQRLRAEVSILGSRHMTLREMELMTNFSYHGLLLIAQQRSVVAECLVNVPLLRTAVATLTSLSGSLPIGQDKLLRGVREFDFEFNCARETLGQLELVVSATLGLREDGDIGPAMRDAISILSNCQALMAEHQSRNANLIVTSPILRERQAMCQCLQKVKEMVQASHNLCCRMQLCLPSDPFETCFAAIEKAIDIGCDLTTHSKSKSQVDCGGDTKVVEHFLTLASKGVQSALLVIQNVHKKRDSYLSEEPRTDPDDDVALWETHRRMCQEWETLGVPGLTSVLVMLTNDLVSIHESEGIPEYQRKWLVSVASDVGTLVEQILKLSLSRLNASISFFRNASKLQYVLARVFRTLVAKGYCADKKSEDSEGDGAGDLSGMKFEDDVEGTGMGEGDGKEDVTDQLESEEQILGLKDDKAKDENESTNDPKKLEEDEAKKGMEMEADFDGDMFDVPDESKEGEGEEDEEEELDREMGDGANDKEDVVDEKMWGESDDDEEINREEEKFEKDSKAKGEAIEEEMRTKDDDEGDINPEGGKSEPQAQTQDEKPPADGADDQDHNINEDLEDNYEERHDGVDVREQEETIGDDGDDMNLDDGLDLNEGNDEEDVDDEEGGRNEDQISEPIPDDEGEDAGNPHAEGHPEIDEEMVNDEEDEDVLETGAVHEGAVVEQRDDTPDDEEQEEPEGPRVDKMNDTNSRQEAFGVKAKDGSGGNQGIGGQREEGHGFEETPVPTQAAPNPFKSPGDATKFWHKKLKIVESGKDAPEEEDATGNDTNEDVTETRNDGEFEYADENEANAGQVLGEAIEESTTAFEDQRPVDEGDQGEEPVDKVNPGSEQEDPQSEQTSSRKASKPTALSNAMEGDPEDEDDEVLGDETEEQDEPRKDTTECDSMDVDGDQSEERSNQVVSDLTQLHIDDDANLLDQAKIIEEDGITRISYEEAAASRVRWNAVAGETHNLARRLCEKLRLVMEPLLATKLKGDYRTGKRINMKKVIGYVASGYRKDKIWLRRTKPAKRNYRVLLAVDNSESMHRSGAGDMALAAMATLAVGMSQLEIGELGIASFGDEMRLLHPFHLPFTSEAGPGIIHSFPFDEKRTRTALCVASALTAMDLHGDHAAMQLMFMISDGRIERDSRSSLRRLMREMVERNILLVMIVVEGDKNEKERRRDSIVHMKEVTFENGKPKVKQFMEDYPFPYYIILEDMQSLPEVLGDALRQWFEMISQLQQR